MGQLRDRMEADLKIRGYSASTQKIYLLYTRQHAKHFVRSPADMGIDDVREFLLHMIVLGWGRSSQENTPRFV
jgi:integrase/recombinase XerD